MPDTSPLTEAIQYAQSNGQGPLTVSSDGAITNQHGETMVMDSAGHLAPAPISTPPVSSPGPLPEPTPTPSNTSNPVPVTTTSTVDQHINTAPGASPSSTSSSSDHSQMSAAVAALTDAQRADLYAQVGDALYNPNWSLAGHIAANMENGVFVAPSFESGKNAANPNASLDWGQLANDLKIDLKPWSTATSAAINLNESDKARLGDKLTLVHSMSAEVVKLSEAMRADLYAQVGDAMYSPTFNLAAHIAANMTDGVFVPPSADLSTSPREGSSWSDWINTNSNELKAWELNTVNTGIFASGALSVPMPTNGSPEWMKLLEETGGASANPGFNYAAHIAAVTSQKVLTNLTEVQVLDLIKETGLTNFNNFDLNAYQELKTTTLEVAKKHSLDDVKFLSPDAALIGSDLNDRIDLQGDTNKIFVSTGDGNDYVTAGSIDNLIYAGKGSDFVDGGSGVDKLLIDDASGNASVSFDELSGKWTISSKAEGDDTVTNVERFVFADRSLAVDLDANAGATAKLLGAVFGSSSVHNAEYVGIGLSLMDDGMSYSELAELAIGAKGLTTPEQICSILWENVVGKPATSSDIEPYKAMLETNQLSVAQLTILAADTSINASNIDLVGLAKSGLEYA